MKQLLLTITAILSISCQEEPKQEFSLTGKTNGIKDGTYLYLDHENITIDSTLVTDNAFEFTTPLASSPMSLWLHTKDFSNYRSFWAEDKPMTFDASKSDFRHATITGSESEELSAALYSEIDSLPRKERLQKEMEFVKNHPNTIVSASMLAIYSTTWGKQKTTELFDQFSEENKASKYGQAVQCYIELNKDPKIGDQFADFKMENTDGELQSLSASKAKVTLLEFWASWCGPCRKENPNLVKTYNTYKPKGFEVFAVSLDESKEDWLQAIESDSLQWVHVSDLKGQSNEASLIYGINGIPDNFLIDQNGEIIARNLRGDELNNKLNEILE
ncbi:TlpA disulfide reductase family protein [Aegicerativicinus sediminis]|uniref:TlpA disulfide reductase family protein n=1 Tax=Aegicerativicinus sediminis TaxID=2893202 RepID=UPI001E5DEFF6|nr:TlpA disulfide reductase family protein [Aegicerativicinus sediminis]